MGKKKLKKEELNIKTKIQKPRLPKGLGTRIHKDKRKKIIDKIHEKDVREAKNNE